MLNENGQMSVLTLKNVTSNYFFKKLKIKFNHVGQDNLACIAIRVILHWIIFYSSKHWSINLTIYTILICFWPMVLFTFISFSSVHYLNHNSILCFKELFWTFRGFNQAHQLICFLSVNCYSVVCLVLTSRQQVLKILFTA